MIDVVDGLDLSGVPIPFLEAYSFPVFVLLIPLAPHARPQLSRADTAVTVRAYEDLSPLAGPSVRSISSSTMVWSNEKWMRLLEGRSLDDCFDQSTLSRLRAWVENRDASEPAALAGAGDGADKIFVLEMEEPRTTLHLSKSVVPLTPASGTHAFCVVLSQIVEQAQSRSRSLSLSSQPTPTGSRIGSDLRMTPSATSDRDRSSTVSDLRLSSTDFGSPSPSNPSGSYFPAASNNRSSQDSRDRNVKGKSNVRRRSPRGDRGLGHLHMHNAALEYWDKVNAFDWSTTALGPRPTWSAAIDPVMSIAFQSKTQDSVWLGPDLNLIYNKAYSPLVPQGSFGKPAKEVWIAVWDYLDPLVKQALAGQSVYRENDALRYRKWGPGLDLEVYHTWRYVPIMAQDGSVLGLFNQSMETTEQVLAERRLASMRDLSETMLVNRTVEEYFSSIAEIFESAKKDAPFVIAYSVKQKEAAPLMTQVEINLQSSVGVPEDHPSAPKSLSLTLPTRGRSVFGPNADRMSSPTLSAISALSSGSGRIHQSLPGDFWPIQKALATRQSVIVDNCRALIQGYEVPEGDPLPMFAIVVPICSDASIDLPDAVFVIGLSPLRPFDHDYEQWINVIRSQLNTGLVSVKSYEEEARRVEDLARMEKAKTAWFRGAAHDLRSPLTLVKGPLEDLLDSNLTPGQKNMAQTAKRNVDRLLRLINTLMDFSRLEAGRVKARFVPTDLGAFVHDVAAVFRSAVERMKIRFNVEVQPSDKLVWVDPSLFETILSNMVGNALKYTERGSITIRLTYTNEHADIAVIDTGMGIPQDEIPIVAEWYHRATTAIHAGTQGSGLGLAMVKELLKLHDGELLVTSSTATENPTSHGSTFTARLPVTPRENLLDFQHPEEHELGKYGRGIAKEAVDWIKDQDWEQSSDGNGGSTVGSGSGSKTSEPLLFGKTDTLLVVEDNVEMRDYIRRIFKSYCHVIEAGNGLEALEIIKKTPPDLILSDMMMPRMGGLQLVAEVRQSEETKFIPMVMLSAMTSDDARVDALIAGAEDFLQKPFKPKELLARVHLHMQVGKKRRTLEQLFLEREAQVTLLSDYCPSGIMRADGGGHITYANAAWRKMAGVGPDVDPDTWPQFVDDKTREWLGKAWQDWIASGVKEATFRWRWLSGVTVSGLFIRLDKVDAKLTGLIGCLTDTSYEEERLVEAEQKRLEAEESKQQQELLIDLTSHEIRTPVSAILQCSSLVRENLMSLKEQLKFAADSKRGFLPTRALLEDLEEDLGALDSIYQCGLVQERIAGDVLSFARIQLEMLSLHDIEMDIRKEAKKVFSVFTSEAKMKKIDLQLEFGKTLTRAQVSGIKTDPVRLGQVVTNLISNAIRFTASSDVRRITLTYEVSFLPPSGPDTCAMPGQLAAPALLPAPEDTPLWLYVSVRDTGPGLGEKEQDNLFKRFSQSNKMIHTRYGGSGLGLFICRKITELLGGAIEVKSQLGQGSVFRFYIRTRTVAPPSALASMIEATSASALSTAPPSPLDTSVSASSSSIALTPSSSSIISTDTPPPDGMENLHLLVVEDNIINQTVLKRQILKAGMTCDVANNGLEALEHIREADRQAKRGGTDRKRLYDCVIMDLEMPIMDGLTALKLIRASEKEGTLARNMVIALTGNARQGQVDQAMAAGMDDVVLKPYKLPYLLSVVKKMAQKKTMMLLQQQSET